MKKNMKQAVWMGFSFVFLEAEARFCMRGVDQPNNKEGRSLNDIAWFLYLNRRKYFLCVFFSLYWVKYWCYSWKNSEISPLQKSAKLWAFATGIGPRCCCARSFWKNVWLRHSYERKNHSEPEASFSFNMGSVMFNSQQTCDALMFYGFPK